MLRLLPALIVGLFVLRAAVASWPGLWIDEVFSLEHARAPIARLWTEGWRLESSPPLYYTALWAWIRLSGDSETAARLLSLALTVVSTLLVQRAAATLAGRAAGQVAAACWLLPALAFEYSLEIRPYALKAVWIAAATAALARALVGHRAGRIIGAGGAIRAIAPIALAGAAAFYTHTTAFAALVGLAAASAFYGWRMRAGAGFAKAWLAGCAALGLLCLPQLAMALGVLAGNRAGLAWIPSSFDPGAVSWVARQFVLGQISGPMPVTVGLGMAVYAGLAAAAWRVRDRVEVLAVGVVLPVVGGFAVWIAGVGQAILMPRTLLWAWVPLAVLVGCAAVRLDWRRTAPRVLATAVLLLSGATLAAWLAQRDVQRPWRTALLELETRIRPGDRVLMLDPEIGCLVERYAGPAVRAAQRARLSLGEHQTFWSGQRIDLGCNALPVVTADGVGARPGAADWLLTGDARQRADAAGLVAREGDRLRARAGIAVGGVQAAVSLVGVGSTRPESR